MTTFFIYHGKQHRWNSIHCDQHVPSTVREMMHAQPQRSRFGEWTRLDTGNVTAQEQIRQRKGGGHICDECRKGK